MGGRVRESKGWSVVMIALKAINPPVSARTVRERE